MTSSVTLIWFGDPLRDKPYRVKVGTVVQQKTRCNGKKEKGIVVSRDIIFFLYHKMTDKITDKRFFAKKSKIIFTTNSRR